MNIPALKDLDCNYYLMKQEIVSNNIIQQKASKKIKELQKVQAVMMLPFFFSAKNAKYGDTKQRFKL